jgi:hypothetical protein
MSLALVIAVLGSGIPAEVAGTPPDATFIKTPNKRVLTTKPSVAVEFTFLSNKAGSHFECAREGGTFAPCSSPLTYRVGEGWHFIMVKAIDREGNADPSPDDFLFKVRRTRR